MAKKHVSAKHLQINKSQSVILGAAAIAAFMLVFSAVAGKALVDQIVYNNKIISGKKTAVEQLEKNVKAADPLIDSYKAFVGPSQNMLGGNPTGTGPKDGDNARLTLNALPSVYDFPALTASFEKILTSQNLLISNISGSDDEVAQAANQSSPQPEPVEMPIEASATGNYDSIKSAIDLMGKSIRPFHINTLQISGGETSMTMTVNAKTYYQPAVNFDVTKKAVK